MFGWCSFRKKQTPADEALLLLPETVAASGWRDYGRKVAAASAFLGRIVQQYSSTILLAQTVETLLNCVLPPSPVVKTASFGAAVCLATALATIFAAAEGEKIMRGKDDVKHLNWSALPRRRIIESVALSASNSVTTAVSAFNAPVYFAGFSSYESIKILGLVLGSFCGTAVVGSSIYYNIMSHIDDALAPPTKLTQSRSKVKYGATLLFSPLCNTAFSISQMTTFLVSLGASAASTSTLSISLMMGLLSTWNLLRTQIPGTKRAFAQQERDSQTPQESATPMMRDTASCTRTMSVCLVNKIGLVLITAGWSSVAFITPATLSNCLSVLCDIVNKIQANSSGSDACAWMQLPDFCFIAFGVGMALGIPSAGNMKYFREKNALAFFERLSNRIYAPSTHATTAVDATVQTDPLSLANTVVTFSPHSGLTSNGSNQSAGDLSDAARRLPA